MCEFAAKRSASTRAAGLLALAIASAANSVVTGTWLVPSRLTNDGLMPLSTRTCAARGST
jgi:hypothetical protein